MSAGFERGHRGTGASQEMRTLRTPDSVGIPSPTGRHRGMQANVASGRRGRTPWPRVSDGQLPAPSDASALARAARAAVLAATDVSAPLTNLSALLKRGRFRVRRESLGAADGTVQAWMVAAENDWFDIFIDTEPSGGWRRQHEPVREEMHRQRARFLIGHEVAHSFFFTRRPGQTPQRWAWDSDEQERFCDMFACALLLPPEVVAATEPRAEEVVRLHREYDVSVQLATRAFADIYRGHAFALLYDDEDDPRPLIPQWSAGMEACHPDWWSTRQVQRLPSTGASATLVPLKSGRRSWWESSWLPERRQVLLVGRR